MYGLPEDFDPAMFVGRRLSAVTFGSNLINLEFDKGVTVTVLGNVTYSEGAQAQPMTDSPPVTSTSLVALVGRAVLAAQAQSKALELRLEGEASIALVDESDQYESFIIAAGDEEIVV